MFDLIDVTPATDYEVSWQTYQNDYVDDYPHFLFKDELFINSGDGYGLCFKKALQRYFDDSWDTYVIPVRLHKLEYVKVTEVL